LCSIFGFKSGTGFTIGDRTIIESVPHQVQSKSLAYDKSKNLFALFYYNNSNANMYIRVGSISNHTMSWSSALALDSSKTLDYESHSIVYNDIAESCVLNYREDNNSDISVARTIDIQNSSTITIGSVSNGYENQYATWGNYAGRYNTLAASTESHHNLALTYSSSSPYLSGAVLNLPYNSTNITAENYIGIATKTVANDAQVEVATIGQIDAQQSGLTAGQKYYLNNTTGALQTTADTISSVAGKALSATKLLITNS